MLKDASAQGDVFSFTRSGPMSLDESNALVGVLTRITQKHSKKVNELINRLEALGPNEREKTMAIEEIVGREIEEWNSKVKKLGGLPRGLWLVDMDSGDGYYCWKFPETHIGFWHDYKSGYTGRIPLEERNKRLKIRQLTEQMDEIEAL
jgi:hypothetical protein